MFRHTVGILSFCKKMFLQFLQILKKWCFEPKKVNEKSSNGHNFPLTEPNCKYLSILERPCYVKFKNNVTKKVLGQKMNRVTSCSFFLQCSSPKKWVSFFIFLNFAGICFDMLRIYKNWVYSMSKHSPNYDFFFFLGEIEDPKF
jgi:hypothetical protein